MSTVSSLTATYSRLIGLKERLGVPQNQRVIVVFYQNTYIVLDPKPKVTRVNPTVVYKYLQTEVAITSNDLQLEEIPRSYNKDMLSLGTYLVDATQVNGVWSSNTRGECAYLDDTGTVEYKVLLRIRSVR